MAKTIKKIKCKECGIFIIKSELEKHWKEMHEKVWGSFISLITTPFSWGIEHNGLRAEKEWRRSPPDNDLKIALLCVIFDELKSIRQELQKERTIR